MRGIDIETTALSPDEGRLRTVQLSTGKGARVFDMYTADETEVKALIREARDLVAHNAVFERKWLKAKLGIDIGIIHDTMIMSQVQLHGQEGDAEQAVLAQPAAAVKRELKREISKEQLMNDRAPRHSRASR